MESFFKTHTYLVEHMTASVRRTLMDEIDWNDRLIGIKGSRGIGKTTFLLQYAKENFGPRDRRCLYVNMNNFYFQGRGIADFASDFAAQGGKVLLIDQIFKKPDWSNELRTCYNQCPNLKIVFTGSSVMRLKEENPELKDIVKSYNLRGFSFREYVNLQTGNNFPVLSLNDIIRRHAEIAAEITSKADIATLFGEYLHHGFYPFFLEHRNFEENLLKTMNMMLEVDVLYIKQIEQSYLPKLRRLLYLLAVAAPSSPNVSQLSKEIGASRATVMNYIKYLSEARLVNMLYPEGESFPKKPAAVYMYNSNLMFPVRPMEVNPQTVREAFFINQLVKDNVVNEGRRGANFLVNGRYPFRIDEGLKGRRNAELHYAVDQVEVGAENQIPLWLFGFLY